MASPSTLYSQPHSKPSRRPRRVEEGEELGKKPKKANSEARKQQNRIASRNYREKRKRKLHYLQQLIKDGSNDEQTPETSPQQQEAHLQPLSADYEAGPNSSPFMLPSHNDSTPIDVNSTHTLDPASIASTAPFNSHLLPTTHAYSPYGSSWGTPMYDPPPPANMMWNVPAWRPPTNYSPRVAPCAETFHFSPPLGVSQPVFEHINSPYRYPLGLMPNPESYTLDLSYGHYKGGQNQTPGTPSVSLPTPSSSFQTHYPGPH